MKPEVLVLVCCLWMPETVSKVYEWTVKDTDYPSAGKYLDAPALKVTTRHVVTQCAMDCLRDTRCQSYNFLHEASVCQLFDVTHNNVDPANFKNNDSSEYYLKDTFSIDSAAVGKCVGATCQNGGRCIESTMKSGESSYKCVCSTLWEGEHCETPAAVSSWGTWAVWEACSVTCGTGWKQRTRNCVNGQTGQATNSFMCRGKEMDIKSCVLQECPRWNNWGDWGVCSSETTCGKGHRTRNRTCSNSGTIGVDRFCMGPSSEIGPCNAIACTAPIRLMDGPDFGEGRVEMLNDLTGSWGVVCATQWDINDANAACKQIGFPEASEAVIDGRYGTGSRPFSATDFGCSSSDRVLQRCPHSVWNENTSCPGSTAAGVKCTVNGDWNLWTSWGTCSVSCADGVQTRTRECNFPPPLHGGQACVGPGSNQRACNEPPCPGSGTWGDWGSWEPCSASCGEGTQRRSRSCVDVLVSCSGSSEDTRTCDSNIPCPVDGCWQELSPWTECDVTCGVGRKSQCTITPRKTEHHGALVTIIHVQMTRSPWDPCTRSYGGGLHQRLRECVGLGHEGKLCEGHTIREQQCNNDTCPVDGVFQEWSFWGECSKTCGRGFKTRTRLCVEPQFGGKDCVGATREEETCNGHPCPVDGEWDEWSDWDMCTASCGGGSRQRERVCTGTAHGGKDCEGNDWEVEDCSTDPCPVDGMFREWSDWQKCSKSCGGGIKRRTRICSEPKFGGKDCEGKREEDSICNTQPCPVDGQWAQWSNWDNCTVTCGGGTRKRDRVCNGTAHGGKDCEGSDWEVEDCSTDPCPVNGVFQNWSPWGECTLQCGGGTKSRTRDCQKPQFGGKDCEGDSYEEAECNNHSCPVDGEWATWSDWDKCSLTCGGGTRKRERICTGTAHGGKYCEGSDWEVEDCNINPCPVDGEFTPWSEWGLCSATCGGGTQTRNRECTLPQHGGRPCDGDRYQIQDCGTDNCPVDGRWDTWGDWNTCSVTCGPGTQVRERTCDGPDFGGKPCVGNAQEDKECVQPPCLIPGDWNVWSEWSICSVTCGGGSRRRSRQCDMETHGDLTAPCDGNAEETEECHGFHCEPYARSCTDLRSLGLLESVDADIDPDGPSGKKPIRVYCDLHSEGGIGQTIIGHNFEKEVKISSYEGPGEYDSGDLKYNATWDQIVTLVDLSASCKQFISWKCKAALIHNNKNENILTTFWRNRHNSVANYWGGAPAGSGKCDCGVNGTCADPTKACNCDSNDSVWREDAGFITVKDDLPVRSFAAGDTGNLDEAGSIVIGPLKCVGGVAKKGSSSPS